ncbi:abc transporter, putative [Leishmania tarentolae]|uniref:Abc transporter, putative n=1 Tax=Leishmania tarentolae TaxID=5689 RepID=A0A640K7C8_LEITA|nr:abc transporter, putative [Leishmania tarentolae]
MDRTSLPQTRQGPSAEAPAPPGQRPSFVSPDLRQSSPRAEFVSPSVQRRSDAGAGFYGGFPPATMAAASQANAPYAATRASFGGHRRSVRWPSRTFGSTVGYPFPMPSGTDAASSVPPQRGRSHGLEEPPPAKRELQYRSISIGPTGWSMKDFQPLLMASSAAAGTAAGGEGSDPSLKRKKASSKASPPGPCESASLSTQPMPSYTFQQQTRPDESEGAATKAIPAGTGDSLPGRMPGDPPSMLPPSAGPSVSPDRQLPSGARAVGHPQEQPRSPSDATVLIPMSKVARSPGAGVPSAPRLTAEDPLVRGDTRSARPHHRGEGPQKDGGTTASRGSGGNSSTENVADSARMYYDMPTSDPRHSGHDRAGHRRAPFGYDSTRDNEGAESASLFSECYTLATVQGGGDDGGADGLELPTAGGAGKTHTDCTWLDQLGATISRDMIERRRRWKSVLLEVVIPLVCTSCVVALWATFGVASSPDHSSLAVIGGKGRNFKSGMYLRALCYNDTWFGGPNYIDGLNPCSQLPASLQESVTCNTVGEEELQVKGLCYTQKGQGLAAFLSGMRDGLARVMPLDDIIAYQWLAKKVLEKDSAATSLLVGAGIFSNTRIDAIQASGKLYFTPRSHVPEDLLRYLSQGSRLFKYVYNDTFDTVEEAHRVIRSGERGPTWALVRINQLDEKGLDVSIEMSSMALPELTEYVDRAYSGGLGYDRANMYYMSGFPSLLDAIVKYYLSSVHAAGATRAEVDSIRALLERQVEQQQQQAQVQAQAAAARSVDVVLDTHELLNTLRAARNSVGTAAQPFTDAAESGKSSSALTPQKASSILATSAALRAKMGFTIFLGSMPWVPFKKSEVLLSANKIIGFVIVMAFLYPVSQMTRRLVLEKERRVREATLIMGLKSVYLWCSWFLHSVALMFTISFFMTLVMCTTFLMKSDAFCVFLVVFMFALTCVPLSGLMATFFDTSRMAVLMTPLLYFAMSLLLFAIFSASPVIYLSLSIFSPTCFAIILHIMFSRESGDGFSMQIFRDPNDNPNTAVLLGFLVLDFCVYLLLMFYLDAVLPKAVGVPKHPLYFIRDPMRHYRRKRAERAWKLAQRRRQASSVTDAANAADEAAQPPLMERKGTRDALGETYDGNDARRCTAHGAAADDDGEDGRDPNGVYEVENFTPEQLSVRVLGLRKVFNRGGHRFVAVRGFFWQLPTSGISVLLGHNGAGKSTVINMMTGMLYPDSGDCYIGDSSIRFDLARARHQIGFCPQHNILWPELTCREHLEFFARLKGLRGAVLEDAVMHTLKEVDLVKKQNDPAGFLSGGMKRKLSVAIAFVGGSSLVFLDEPTAGMDVAARRHTWRLLLRMSRNRSVLLTTHFMDEADLLGDRVAIMSRGQLKCSGSSLFLKSRLGIGYNISISVDELLRVRDLDTFLAQHVPEAERLTTSGGEVGYRLPAKYVERFPGLLHELDTVGPLIGIRGYAISPTTLEEVFLTIARDAAEDDKRRAKAKSDAAVVVRNGCLPDLWRRLCCGCGGGTAEKNHASSDPFDGGDEEEDDNGNVGHVCDTFGRGTQEVSQYSAMGSSASPMQHQPAPVATSSEQLPSHSVSPGTGYVGDYKGNDAGNKESPAPSGPSSKLGEPAKSGAPKAGDGASQHNTARDGESMQSTAACVVTPSSAAVGYPTPCAPTAAAVTPVAAAAEAPRETPADVIWNCEIVFSTSTVCLLQTEAMMRKRFWNMKRDRRALCFQIICPAACILLAMLLSLVGAPTVHELKLNTTNYPYDTLWDTTGCAEYFSTPSDLATSIAPNQRMRDLNTETLADFYYSLQDEWLAHGKTGKYSAIACGRPVVAMLPTINADPVVLLTNYSSYHEFPMAMVNFYNLLLKEARGPSVSITASAGVLPSDDAPASQRSIKLLLTAIIIIVPFTFLPANCVAWVVKERECRSRHLQDICGLRYLIYWFSNFVFDFSAYAVTMLLVITIFAVFRREEYIGADAVGATFTLLSVYGFCSTTTAYFVHFFFATHSSAQSVVMAVGFITGFLLVIMIFVLRLLPLTEATSKKLVWAFRVFPTYAVSEGIVNLAMLPHFRLSDSSLNAFSMETIGWPCVYMAVEGPVFLILTLLIDHPYWRMRLLMRGYDPRGDATTLARAQRRQEHAKSGGGGAHHGRPFGHPDGQETDGEESTDDSFQEDSDVEDERVEVRRRMDAYREDLKRQENMYMNDTADYVPFEMAATSTTGGTSGDFPSLDAKVPIIDAVAVVGLRKQYSNGKVAVQDVSFGVVPGEVFGLLGTNGAGKTTTMSMLCQEFYPTTGRVYVCGYDIVEESGEALQCVGYCPQFDATLDLLTVEEHLRVFAGIRGIAREQHKSVVSGLLHLTGLREYRHTTSAALSGGNRRKLSVALSLIGGPPVVIFDEPSAGMDPVARREIWTSMQAIRHRCSIILCTHHLEEVEALADCVAIMVDGRLRCIGSKVHLKQKYGSGFEMTLRVQPPSTAHVSSSTTGESKKQKREAEAAALEEIRARLIAFVTASFPSSQVSEVRGKRLVFSLPKNTSLSSVFQSVQRNRAALCISDYTVSQTSIEQIFMRVSDEAEKAERVRAALVERRLKAENALRRKHEQLRLEEEEEESAEGQLD